jgi:hypothetical protein
MQAEPSDCLIGMHYRGSTPEKSFRTKCGIPVSQNRYLPDSESRGRDNDLTIFYKAAGGDRHDCMQESGHGVRQCEFEAGKEVRKQRVQKSLTIRASLPCLWSNEGSMLR